MKELKPSNQLTAEEAAWLLQILENMQINGKPSEVRDALRTVDSIAERLRVMMKEGT